MGKKEEEQFFSLLSLSLKDDIMNEVNGKVLGDCNLFSANFSNKAFISMSQKMVEKLVSPDQIIFQVRRRRRCEHSQDVKLIISLKNQWNNFFPSIKHFISTLKTLSIPSQENVEDDFSIYFITYGRIQILSRGQKLASLEKNQYFGEMSFFSRLNRLSNARAVQFGSLFELKREDAIQALKEHPADFQQFHFIKDNVLLYENYSYLQISCFSCNQPGHAARNCPKAHPFFDREKTIKNYINAQKFLCSQFVRNNRERFHALSQRNDVYEAFEMIQEDFNNSSIMDEKAPSLDEFDDLLERNITIKMDFDNYVENRRRESIMSEHAPRRRSLFSNMNAHINKSNSINVHQPQAQGLTVVDNGIIRPSFQRLHSGLLQKKNSEQYQRQGSSIEEVRNILAGVNPKDLKKEEQDELLFFQVDKVANFEVYFPHNNITSIIQDMEYQRIERIQKANMQKFKVMEKFGMKMGPDFKKDARFQAYQILESQQSVDEEPPEKRQSRRKKTKKETIFQTRDGDTVSLNVPRVGSDNNAHLGYLNQKPDSFVSNIPSNSKLGSFGRTDNDIIDQDFSEIAKTNTYTVAIGKGRSESFNQNGEYDDEIGIQDPETQLTDILNNYNKPVSASPMNDKGKFFEKDDDLSMSNPLIRMCSNTSNSGFLNEQAAQLEGKDEVRQLFKPIQFDKVVANSPSERTGGFGQNQEVEDDIKTPRHGEQMKSGSLTSENNNQWPVLRDSSSVKFSKQMEDVVFIPGRRHKLRKSSSVEGQSVSPSPRKSKRDKQTQKLQQRQTMNQGSQKRANLLIVDQNQDINERSSSFF